MTCDNNKVANSDSSACVCPADSIADGDGCMTCLNDRVANADNSVCVCPPNTIEDDTGVCAPQSDPNCPGDLMEIDRLCQCPEGLESFVVNDVSGPLCAPALPVVAGAYNPVACSDAGWEDDFVADDNRNLAQRCLIPFRIVAAPVTSTVSATVASVLNDATPNNVELVPGVASDSCIMRSHENYDGSDPLCPDVFGTTSNNNVRGSFPQARNFGANEVLEIVIVPNGISNILPSQTRTAVNADNGGGTRSKQIVAGVGAFGVIVMSWFLASGDSIYYNWTPQAEFAVNDRGGVYVYGSKFEYHADNWRGYWQAAQTHSGGALNDWIYGSGTAWKGDVFAASVNSTAQGLDADTEFSLSAHKSWSVWTLQSAYTADWKVRGLNDSWQNRLSLGADVVLNQWTVSPKAFLAWQEAESVGENAGLQLHLRREL